METAAYIAITCFVMVVVALLLDNDDEDIL